MLEKVKKLYKYLNQHSGGRGDIMTPQGIHAEFGLKYKSLTIGYLELHKGVWKFFYSQAFKNQDELQPIVQFSDKNKTYENEELWPFFTVRIPGLNQPEIKNIIESENIDRTNEVELLKRFGEKTIFNPYEFVGAA